MVGLCEPCRTWSAFGTPLHLSTTKNSALPEHFLDVSAGLSAARTQICRRAYHICKPPIRKRQLAEPHVATISKNTTMELIVPICLYALRDYLSNREGSI